MTRLLLLGRNHGEWGLVVARPPRRRGQSQALLRGLPKKTWKIPCRYDTIHPIGTKGSRVSGRFAWNSPDSGAVGTPYRSQQGPEIALIDGAARYGICGPHHCNSRLKILLDSGCGPVIQRPESKKIGYYAALCRTV